MDAPPMTRGVFRWLLLLAAARLSFSTAGARNRWMVFRIIPKTARSTETAQIDRTNSMVVTRPITIR
ncbi:MAG TPA: hypothetical protein VJN18_18885 [Polyangiaceae bacterium]|nr:hypothetical protein [Polyangiaceae bacterium]